MQAGGKLRLRHVFLFHPCLDAFNFAIHAAHFMRFLSQMQAQICALSMLDMPKSIFLCLTGKLFGIIVCLQMHRNAYPKKMNITVSIEAESTEGKAIMTAARTAGIDAEDMLMGVCLNAARRACTAQDAAAADAAPAGTAADCCPPAAAPATAAPALATA